MSMVTQKRVCWWFPVGKDCVENHLGKFAESRFLRSLESSSVASGQQTLKNIGIVHTHEVAEQTSRERKSPTQHAGKSLSGLIPDLPMRCGEEAREHRRSQVRTVLVYMLEIILERPGNQYLDRPIEATLC